MKARAMWALVLFVIIAAGLASYFIMNTGTLPFLKKS